MIPGTVDRRTYRVRLDEPGLEDEHDFSMVRDSGRSEAFLEIPSDLPGGAADPHAGPAHPGQRNWVNLELARNIQGMQQFWPTTWKLLGLEAVREVEDTLELLGRLDRRSVRTSTRTSAVFLLAHSRAHAARETLSWELKDLPGDEPGSRLSLVLVWDRTADTRGAWSSCRDADGRPLDSRWLAESAPAVRGPAPERKDASGGPMKGVLLGEEGYRRLIEAGLLLPQERLELFTAEWVYARGERP